MVNAMQLQTICIKISIVVNFASCIGPKYKRTRLINVKLLVVTYPSFSCHFTNFRNLNNLIKNLPISPNFEYWNLTKLQSNWSVSALYFGKRCRGHSIKWNNCGTENRKLKTCGMKNNKVVLLKWPKMPTTAKVMPEK